MLPYNITLPDTEEIPIVVSVPHCGVAFPEDIRDQYKNELIKTLDDTDWFVDQLYGFAPSLGITMITANYSRWVVDLNRDPESKPLYTDGRIITGLCPTTDFLGNPIYKDHREHVKQEEIKDRLYKYYWPYHHKLQELIKAKKEKFGKVLLWDCHSIRQQVPTIYNGKFPDLILGSADERSASLLLIETALQNLKQGAYQVSHNYPFKGGYITRAYGKPGENVHALQLEMCKIHYMDDEELRYDANRASDIQSILIKTLQVLAKKISG
jgi:N-formylglutamate deformylase